jgi:hypothetical protein
VGKGDRPKGADPVRPQPTPFRVFRPLQKPAVWFLQQEKPWHARQKTMFFDGLNRTRSGYDFMMHII